MSNDGQHHSGFTQIVLFVLVSIYGYKEFISTTIKPKVGGKVLQLQFLMESR